MRRALILSFLAVTALLSIGIVPLDEKPAFATGSGIIRINGEVRNFTFNAHLDKDGVTRGRGQLHNRDQDVQMKFQIDCLMVWGNVATMSGHYVRSSDLSLEGAPIWFRVVDNGEGENAPPDEITLVVGFFGPGVSCREDYPLDLFPIEGGNIQVHHQ